MILAFTLAITMAQTSPTSVAQARPKSEDIYCAAIAVHLSERVVERDQTDAITGMAAMTFYFLGRVEGSMPPGEASEAVLDMAEILDHQTITQAEITSCADFMMNQWTQFFDDAHTRGRSLE